MTWYYLPVRRCDGVRDWLYKRMLLPRYQFIRLCGVTVWKLRIV